jgi:hypothetical protein
MEKPSCPVERLLRDHPRLREPLDRILEVDRERQWWEFDDVPIDSGDFGELVSFAVIEKGSDGYRLADPDAVARALGETESNHDQTVRGSTFDRPLEQSARESAYSLLYNRWFTVAVIVVLVAASVVRLWTLGSSHFFGDEIWQVWASKTFLLGEGFSNPVGPSLPYDRAWLTTSLPIAGSFWLFGYTEFAGRLPAVVYGVATILVYYVLSRDLFDRRIAVVFAAVLAFEPYMISWSRMARDYAPLQFFFALGALLFYRWYVVDSLRLRSKFLIAFVLVSPFGEHTHPAYLGIGPALVSFLAVALLADHLKARLYDTEFSRAFAYRRVVIGAVALVAGVALLAIRGVPAQLTAAPEWFGGRPVDFYLQLFQSEYPVLFFVFLAGVVYNLVRSTAGRYLAIVFLIPFLIHTYSPWREPRYIAHVYPLFVLIAVSTTLIAAESFVRWMNDWERRRFDVRGYDVSMSGAAVVVTAILLLTVSASPVSALLFVSENPHGYMEDRSDHRSPAQDLGDQIEADHAVISSTPHMTMWYLDREQTDYMLSAQRPEERFETQNSRTIDPRTGTVVLNGNCSALLDTIERHDTGWFFADTRYRFYVDSEMKRAVDENMVRLSSDRWNNIDVYYWGPEERLEAFERDSHIQVHR